MAGGEGGEKEGRVGRGPQLRSVYWYCPECSRGAEAWGFQEISPRHGGAATFCMDAAHLQFSIDQER